MHKKLFSLILLFCLAIGVSGCDRQKNIILFNHNPITKETLLNNATEFEVKKRIYYIYISQKPINTEFIRVILQKREEKADFVATKVVYSNDFRLNKDQIYYYTDYLVLEDGGYYCMKIYATSNLSRPLAIADFRVKN